MTDTTPKFYRWKNNRLTVRKPVNDTSVELEYQTFESMEKERKEKKMEFYRQFNVKKARRLSK